MGQRRPRWPAAKAPRTLHALTVCDNAEAFGPLLPARGSLLALDVSKRRIGLAGHRPRAPPGDAAGDLRAGRGAARPGAAAAAVRERQAVGLVLGLPLNMDGSEGPMARTARAEAASFASGLALPVLLQDERLSTFAVEDAIAEGRLPRPAQRASRSTITPPW